MFIGSVVLCRACYAIACHIGNYVEQVKWISSNAWQSY